MQLAQHTYEVCVAYLCCWIRGMRNVCKLLAQETYVPAAHIRVYALEMQLAQHLLLVQHTYVRAHT